MSWSGTKPLVFDQHILIKWVYFTCMADSFKRWTLTFERYTLLYIIIFHVTGAYRITMFSFWDRNKKRFTVSKKKKKKELRIWHGD